MKVKELVALLLEQDQERVVVIRNYSDSSWMESEPTTVFKNNWGGRPVDHVVIE